MKPKIGVIPLYDETKDSYWMLPGYMKVLEQCGALPLMLPLTTDEDTLADCAALCDGLLLTGGHDVDPALYGAAVSPACGLPCPERDAMETSLLRRAVAQDIPVLGICRGVQLLNAALGGTLYQDLPSERPTAVDHHMTAPYDRAQHTVEILPATPLAAILGAGTLPVNSYHHQGVRQPAPALVPMAVAEDGLVEALYYPGKRFLAGVQWHPEFAYQNDAASVKIVQAFVDACRG